MDTITDLRNLEAIFEVAFNRWVDLPVNASQRLKEACRQASEAAREAHELARDGPKKKNGGYMKRKNITFNSTGR